MNFRELHNYVKIDKFSKTIEKVQLSNSQEVLIENILFEIYELQNKAHKLWEFDQILFFIPKLLLEGESTNLIEGTRSMIEDFAYDIEEINNIPQWTSRNLINIYKKYLLDDLHFKKLKFSLDLICQMHQKLYENDPSSKFKMTYNPTKEIERTQPGVILTNDKKPNYIGVSKDIKKANIVMLKPSLKKEYLNDLCNTIESKISKKEFRVHHIILSHPIFEAIHPFNDGNGRIGRLILSLLFKKFSNFINIPIYLSEAFAQNHEKYKKTLLNVQLNNDMQSWKKYIDYFIDCLLFTKRQMKNRIEKILASFEKVQANKKVLSTSIRQNLVAKFFKHIILNKNITIKILQRHFAKVSTQTLYNDWNLVVKELKIINNGNGYYIFTNLLNIMRDVV